MNSKHLGDAFDHWKGSLIQLLKPKLQNIAAVPMITDKGGWDKQEQKLSTYSRLLNIDERLIFQFNRKFTGHRDNDRYFQEIDHSGDLFLDPDIGVAFSVSTRKGTKHVTPEEIKLLLDNDKGNTRVIMVYQQKSREKSQEQRHLREIINYALPKIGSRNSPCYACTYWCSHVSMLFFSKNEGRIVQLEEYLRNKLPYQAKTRVKKWPK